MHVESFFHAPTSSFSHLIVDDRAQACALIDTVRDFDYRAGKTSTESADRIIARIAAIGARLEWILETHVHADHLSAATYVKSRVGGRIGIGRDVERVRVLFAPVFPRAAEERREPFDHFFSAGERFAVGGVEITVMHTPGHTPACITYVATERGESAAFVGDTLFPPECGTARCDFPGGDAAALYASVAAILALPSQTRLYVCHDYPPFGRAPSCASTVAEQKTGNVHVHDGVTEAGFVAMRRARDATLEVPALLLPAIQVNLDAGLLPEPDGNRVRYLKIPVDSDIA